MHEPRSTGEPRSGIDPGSRHQRRARPVLGMVVLASVLAGPVAAGVATAALAPTAAVAAEHAAGYDVGLGWLGAYSHPDGTRAYCLQVNGAIPYRDTSGSALSSDWNGLSPDELARINYVLATRGDTADADQAAAVALFVWSVADRAAYDSHEMPGDDYYSPRAGSHRSDVLAELAAIRAEAAGVTAASTGAPTGNATLEVSADASAMTGSVTFHSSPAGLAGVVHLENAVFDDSTPSATMTDGESRPIRVIPSASSTFHVSARSDEITVPAVDGYAGNITVWAPGQVSEQYTASAGQRVGGPFVVAGASATSAEIDGRFSPVAATRVSSQRVDAGAEASDILTVGVADGSPSWRTLPGGPPAGVEYTGRLYGPFSTQPAESDAPPAGAPLAGEVSVTATGPGAVTGPAVRVAESGFYTWVWSVAAAEQSESVRALLPDGYTWSDRFGVVAETSIVPFSVEAVSAVDAEQTAVGMRSTDSLTLTSTGRWLEEGGVRVPVTAEGTAYWVEGSDRPMRGEVPADARALGTASLTFAEPGTQTADVPVPADASGHVVWVWRIGETLHHSAWSDSFGEPGEVSRVEVPRVVTSARAETPLTDAASDEAVVDGLVPDGATLAFEAYRVPEGEAARCLPEQRVYDGSSQPVAVDAGRNEHRTYRSAEVRLAEAGTYAWVETLRTADGRTVHRGECGAPGETTRVTVPGVTTRAQADVALTDGATDEAIVTGAAPVDASLVWRVYQGVDGAGSAVCTPETLVAETAAVRVDGPGSYTSPTVVLPREGDAHWVEELRAADGRVLVSGACGAEGETTTVHRPTVSTVATTSIEAGATAIDTAVIDGWVPEGARVVFDAFRQEGDAAVCEVDGLVARRTEAGIAVPAGPADGLRIDGPPVQLEAPGRYHWVETLLASDGTELHRGECGAAGETTTVTAADGPAPIGPAGHGLASTGIDLGIPLLGGAAAIAIGGLALVGVVRRTHRARR